LFATSTVGASTENSADWRQFRISAVSMIPAATVLLLFFFGNSTKNSTIRRRPLSAS